MALNHFRHRPYLCDLFRSKCFPPKITVLGCRRIAVASCFLMQVDPCCD